MSNTAAQRTDGEEMPEVVVIGATCLDIKGRTNTVGVSGTSNPGMVRVTAGGCGRNIAENLARFGTSVALLSVACADDFGRAIIRQTEQAGVNTDHVLISCDHHSASYIALLDRDGQLMLGVDDTAAMAAIGPEYIADHANLLRGAHMVMLDANLPIESTAAALNICREAGIAVGFDPVAYDRARRYRELIGQFNLVTPNAIEAKALTGMPVRNAEEAIRAAKQLVSLGVEIAIITLAGQGVTYATADGSGHVPAFDVEIVDATGASDALTATVIYGMVNGLAVDEAIRLGVSAATLTLQTADTVRQDLSLESLYAQLVI